MQAQKSVPAFTGSNRLAGLHYFRGDKMKAFETLDEFIENLQSKGIDPDQLPEDVIRQIVLDYAEDN